MNEEELYKLALSDVPKYSLLNEILAIRDKRFPNEEVDYCINVNGYISSDVLNEYVKMVQENQRLKEEKERLKNCYSSITIIGRKQGKAYEEAKRYITVCDLLGLKDIKITLVDSDDKKRIEKAIDNLEKSIKSIDEKIAHQDYGENYINDYRKVRLRAIRSKSKEILSILKGEENVKEDKTTI